MRIRHSCLVLALLLLVPRAANAHIHVWDFYFGPSYAYASHLTGFQVTFGLAVPADYPLHKFSVVVDTSVHTGMHQETNIRRSMISGGLRYTPQGEGARHLTSVQVLVGRTWDNTNLDDDSGWGVTMGAIYEFMLDDTNPDEGWALRAQGDFVSNSVDKFPRLTTGFAYHFR